MGREERAVPEALPGLSPAVAEGEFPLAPLDGPRPWIAMRWWVMGVIFLLSFITIVDRVCIAVAKTAMAKDMGISDIEFGGVFSAFAVGYAILMVPSGWMADRMGPRKFLAIIVVLWSLCTLGTGLVYALTPLLIIRVAFGMAEAGAYPTATRAIYNWFPMRQRGLALGLLNTGSRLGAAIGVYVMSLSVAHLGWRESYWLLGGLGIVWALVWYVWFRDNPSQKRGMTAGELAEINLGRAAPVAKMDLPKLRWGDVARSRNVYLILLQYFASNFNFFICFTWLPSYTQKTYDLTAADAGFYASIPLYAGALATCISGSLVDLIYRKGYWRASRIGPAITGFALATICLFCVKYTNGVNGFIVCMAIMTFGVDMTLSPSWTTSSDVGKHYTGTLSGMMNTAGAIGTFVCGLAFPLLLKHTGGPNAFFMLAAGLNVVAIACWCAIRPDRPLLSSDAERART